MIRARPHVCCTHPRIETAGHWLAPGSEPSEHPRSVYLIPHTKKKWRAGDEMVKILTANTASVAQRCDLLVSWPLNCRRRSGSRRAARWPWQTAPRTAM